MEDRILHVNGVRYVRDYILEIDFDDGTTKAVNIEPLLTGPVFEPLKDKETFSRIVVDPVSRTVVWPNGADLAPEALFQLPAVERVA